MDGCNDLSMWRAVVAEFSEECCNPECPYLMEYTQSHPWGETTAAETLFDCSMDSVNISADPGECPGVQSIKTGTYHWRRDEKPTN